MEINKIFGVGLYRTGTSSLALALQTLGHNTVHHYQFMTMVEDLNTQSGRKLLYGIDDCYDAFFDGNIMYRFRELDRQYPGSLFICTEREIESWLKSIMCRIHDDTTRRVKALPDNSPEFWRQHYTTHYDAVKRYFLGRSDILYINICEGDGWQKLCGFLDSEVPDAAFPHENKSEGHGPVASMWDCIVDSPPAEVRA